MANRRRGIGVRCWVLWVAFHCLLGCKNSDSRSTRCQSGDEGCECFGNQTCIDGLICRSDRCVDAGTGGAKAFGGDGAAGDFANSELGGSASTTRKTESSGVGGGKTDAGGGNTNAGGGTLSTGGVGINSGIGTGGNTTTFAGGASAIGGTSTVGGTTSTGSTIGTVNYQFKAKAISAGKIHACAVLIDGTVRCWGGNITAQLGDVSMVAHSIPVAVANINNAIGVAASETHTCALLSTGGVKCWGQDQMGQLGNNSTAPVFLLPVDVVGVTNAVAISAGEYYSCALLSTGTVQCWGLNRENQLGYVPTGAAANVLVPATDLVNVTTMSSGGGHSCARLNDGTVKCWGSNYSGEVGIQPLAADPTTSMVAPPVPVAGLTGVKAIAAGMNSSCAVLESGAMKCWGDNHYGQLGLVLNYTSYEPVPVSGMATARLVTIGDAHACALLQDSTVSCWGENTKGQLGSKTSSLVINAPIAVPGLSGVTAIDAGTKFTCALLDTGDVKCWGDNYYGQLGNGTKTDSSTPVTVLPGDASKQGAAGPIPDLVKTLSAGQAHTCALWESGRVKCWGKNNFYQLGNSGAYQARAVGVRNAPNEIAGIDLGDLHSCAVTNVGAAFCWGQNDAGEVGDGTTYDQYYPTPVWHLFEPMSVISAGGSFTCGVLATGKVVCWGGKAIGDSYAMERHTPTEVVNLSGAVDVQAGVDHACALLGDGRVFCWGANTYGQLGDGTTTTRLAPVQVSGITTAVKMGKGFAMHTCVVLSDATVKCWGANSYSQLGDGTKTHQSLPVTVDQLKKVQSVVMGGSHTCALTTDNDMRCWGANSEHQLGDGTKGERTGLVAIYKNPKVLTMTAGSRHTCALFGDYQIYCWGYNENGEVASGDNQAFGGFTPSPIFYAE